MLSVQLLRCDLIKINAGCVTDPVLIHFQQIYTRKQEFYG